MPGTLASQLPDDLYQGVIDLGYFAAPHKRIPNQAEALEQLHQALNAGQVEQILDTLHIVAKEFRRDIHGSHIPMRLNWTTRTAIRLTEEIEGWLRSRRKRSSDLVA